MDLSLGTVVYFMIGAVLTGIAHRSNRLMDGAVAWFRNKSVPGDPAGPQMPRMPTWYFPTWCYVMGLTCLFVGVTHLIRRGP